MKNVRNNNLIRKIAIIILFIMCSNILIPNCAVTAKTFSDDEEEPGGSLFQPIMDFLVFLADSVMNVLQHNFITLQDVVYSGAAESTGTFSWGWLGTALLGIVAVAYGVACVYTGGAALAIGTVITGIITTVGGVAASVYAFGTLSDLKAGEFDIPYIMYNPYTIFSGGVPALDINYINPRTSKIEYANNNGSEYIYAHSWAFDNMVEEAVPRILTEFGYTNISSELDETIKSMISKIYKVDVTEEAQRAHEYTIDGEEYILYISEFGGIMSAELCLKSEFDEYPEDRTVNLGFTLYSGYTDDELEDAKLNFQNDLKAYFGTGTEGSEYDDKTEELKNLLLEKKEEMEGTEEDQYVTYVTYKNAIGNDVEIFMEWNSYNNDGYHYTIYTRTATNAEVSKEYKSSAAILQSSIATWYNVLRRIALVGLLSVLVYVGIRMVISATAADMAKYKKMFLDWLVAVCLLFVLHYIMILILTVSTNLTEIFQEAGCTNMTFVLPKDSTINGQKITDNISKVPVAEYNEFSQISVTTDGDGNPYPLWTGEFMGYIRLKAGSTWSRNQMIYGLMYLVLVIDVCMFTFMYLKRVLYMAFLTMIAPLIALTYPIDKIKDGQAQAFGLWLREYIFNALIQPVHLIIYTMVISTVIELAVDHPVYALVALGFMLPAEKFIRSMFGFQKASTVDNLGGAFGGAALMGLVGHLSKLGKMKGNKKGDKGPDKIRTADKNGAPINLPDIDGAGTGDEGFSSPRMANNTPLPDAEPSQRTGSNNSNVDSDGYEYASNLFGHAQQLSNLNNAANSNNQSRNAKPTVRSRFSNAMTSMANRGKNRILKAKPLRTVGRFTAMGAGAATLGMVGLAAGISTGDFGNVLKYTGAGMGVGGALGKSVGDFAMDKGSQIKENFKEGFMGSEEYNNQMLDREYFNGQGYQEMLDNHSLMPNLSGPEREHALRQEIEEYRSYGLTDNKQIASCMQAGLSSDEGICALQIAKNLSGMNLDSAGKDAYKAAYKRQLGGQFSSSKIDNIWKVIESNM